jgi:ribonuclease P protein component
VRFRLVKDDRLLKRADFVALSEAGRRVHAGLFLALVAPNHVGRPRLGITVSRKVGGAVQRNRIKRQVRECFRLNRRRLDLSGDIAVIARSGAAALSNRELRDAIEALFEKIPGQTGG